MNSFDKKICIKNRETLTKALDLVSGLTITEGYTGHNGVVTAGERYEIVKLILKLETKLYGATVAEQSNN